MILWFKARRELHAKIATLERDLREKLLESDVNWSLRNEARSEALAAEQRVKELEGEREILLRAITGIGPELLRRLTDKGNER